MLNVMQTILNTPTAPTRENLVISQIEKICHDNKIPNYTDSYGNFYVGASSESELLSKPFLFSVHADHPGGVIVRKVNGRYLCKWLGGYPRSLADQNLIIFNQSTGKTYQGRCKAEEFIKGYNFFILDTDVDINESEFKNFGICLNFEAKIHGDVVLCRAADNLASVALVSAWLNTKKGQLDFVFVFTKCEEESRSGAKKIAEHLQGKYSGTVISIDVMERIPGIGLGSGLIIKHGDADTKFSKKVTDFLISICKKFKYTEINISRGNNEASIFVKHGLSASSLGFAIENYHNASLFAVKSRPEEFFIPDCLELAYFLDYLSSLISRVKNVV